MRTSAILALLTLALAVVLTPVAMADHGTDDLCGEADPGSPTCHFMQDVYDATYHYAACFVYDEGPGNWLTCV